MITLSKEDLTLENRQSSKGNQMKWLYQNHWYKADYTGYEGLAEYMISGLLACSSLSEHQFVNYETEQIQYGNRIFTGCKSQNFLPEHWQLYTLERLFQIHYQESLYQTLFSMEEKEKRLEFLVEYVIRMTGLYDFGMYMSILMTVDALFLNEDRHTHNIAVLLDPQEQFHYCPIFDNGVGLFSDTTMDYPLDLPVQSLFGSASAKTFSTDFDEQMDIAEKLYGQHLKFHFSGKQILDLLERDDCYPAQIKDRVYKIILEQMRKYRYLFTGSIS